MMKTPITMNRFQNNRFGGLPIREVHSSSPPDLPLTSLVQLFTALRQVRPEGRGAIVQFITVTPGCDGERLALDMAWASASTLGKKVLVLNGSKYMHKPYLDETAPSPRNDAPADDVVSPVSLKDYLVKVHGLSLYIANLQDAYGGQRALVALDEIVGALRELAESFDMVVIVAPPVDEDPLTTMLAPRIDGNILVVEADKTRRPAAMRVLQAVLSSGGAVLGAALNNHKPHAYRLHS